MKTKIKTSPESVKTGCYGNSADLMAALGISAREFAELDAAGVFARAPEGVTETHMYQPFNPNFPALDKLPVILNQPRVLGYGTVTDLTKLLRISERGVHRLVQRRVAVQVERGVYDLDQSLREYTAELRRARTAD